MFNVFAHGHIESNKSTVSSMEWSREAREGSGSIWGVETDMGLEYAPDVDVGWMVGS